MTCLIRYREDMNISTTPESARPRWGNPVHLLAFGLGSGAFPLAPGTMGTPAAVPIYLLMRPLPDWAYLLLVVFLFLLGIWLCGTTSRDLGVHDHGGIVWDEFVGFWITMFMIPPQWYWLLLGFVLFRFFDIIKPFPIKWLDNKVKGGFGIMVDDVLAGVFAWIILIITVRIVG